MISKSLNETRKIAEKMAKDVRPKEDEATIVALAGNLGAGKTTFTKYFAEALGIPEKEIASPTFVIMKSYDLDKKASKFKKFIHIDAYRLEKAEDIEKLGWRELLKDTGSLILIEWPENIGEAVPQSAQRISFRFVDENTREIVFN